MTTATAAIGLGNPVPVASIGVISVSLLNAAGAPVSNQNINDNGSSTSQTAVFDNVAPGTYTVQVARYLADNTTVVGAPMQSAPFTVAPVLTATVPTSVTVTLA